MTIVETGFRVYYYCKKEPISSEYAANDVKNLTRNDALLGWAFQPDYNGYVPDARYDYKTYMLDPETGDKIVLKTNSLGLRADEPQENKTPGHIRMICLGDSIMEGQRVGNDKTPPNLLEGMLNEHSTDKKFEVFNCAMRGYGISQEYLLLKNRLVKYRPDIVILGYYLNDGITFFRPKSIFLIISSNKILQKSAFYHAFEKLIMKYMIKIEYKYWTKNQFMWTDLYSRKPWRQNKRYADVLVRMAFREWGIAWTPKGREEVFNYLNKFADLSKEHNFKLVIFCFPINMQVYSPGGQDIDLFKPQKDIRHICRAGNISFLDPPQSLRA